MAWTTPTTATVSQILTAARWNSEVRDDLRYLKGLDGPVAFSDIIQSYVSSTGANATSALYLGDSGGVARAGVWGQRNASNSGGRLIFLTNNDSGTLVEAGRFDQNQNYGVGTTSPQGRLDVRTAEGGCVFWSCAALGATPLTVLPAGTISNTSIVNAAVQPSSSGGTGRNVIIAKGTSDSGITGLAFNCNSDGSFTVSRISGTTTYRIGLWLVWC